MSVVTEASLAEIGKLKNLTTLNLEGTETTDAGVGELKNLKKLTTLNPSSTLITDDGLTELREMKTLTGLYVGNTLITDTGLKKEKNPPRDFDMRLSKPLGPGLFIIHPSREHRVVMP